MDIKSKYTNVVVMVIVICVSTVFPWERARSASKFSVYIQHLDLCPQKSEQDQEVSLRWMI